jgi:mono/diheme cytochrome c family protein
MAIVQQSSMARATCLLGLLFAVAPPGAERLGSPTSVAASQEPARTATATDAVTPVEGPSTLRRLGLTIEQSSIGSASWAEGVPPSTSGAAATLNARAFTGADIYRVSCQPCHKADGSGALAEVRSLLYPVQSASVTWLTENAKAAGRPVDAAAIRRQSASAEAALRERLKSGGHNMPSFAHLSDAEINVLRPYLDQLASVPGAERQQRQIVEQPTRVGELVAKGTCHICHDATSATKTPATALNGVIPSLATIAKQQTQADVGRKLRQGGLVPLHAGGQPTRQGRMPVLGYLSDADIASVYMYLIAYPPK